MSFFVPWRKLQLTIPKVVRDTLDPVRNHDTWKLKLSNSVNKRTIVSPKVFILRNAFIIDPFNETKWFKIPILLLNYINHYYSFHCKTYIVLPYPKLFIFLNVNSQTGWQLLDLKGQSSFCPSYSIILKFYLATLNQQT